MKLHKYIKGVYLFLDYFTNSLGELDSIPGQVIPKTQKIVFDNSLLSTQHYIVWIKGKWNNPGKGVMPSPTPEIIEKRAFKSPLTLISQLTDIFIYFSYLSSLERVTLKLVEYSSEISYKKEI